MKRSLIVVGKGFGVCCLFLLKAISDRHFSCLCELSYKYLFSLCCLFLVVFFHNALPFVGFGFLDNAIMIAAVS